MMGPRWQLSLSYQGVMMVHGIVSESMGEKKRVSHRKKNYGILKLRQCKRKNESSISPFTCLLRNFTLASTVLQSDR